MLISVVVTVTSRRSGAENEGRSYKEKKTRCVKKKIRISGTKEHRASHKRPLRFLEENDYENEIFSILSGAHALTSVILSGKRNSRLHSVTGCYNVGKCRRDGNKFVKFVCQMLEVLPFCERERA